MGEILYRAFDVWQRREGCLVRYRCLEDLSTGKYAVQSSDYLNHPFRALGIAYHEYQFIDLLAEEEPAVRGGRHDSILEAIEAHERAFS